MNKPADLWSMREKVIFVFGVIMSLVYLVIGLSLLSIGNFLAEYDKIVKIGIGCIFIAYSFFRLWRAFTNWKNSNNEDEA